ncbi:hypothetical protein SDRG_10059 [Saprolegnia diclina VS20]|uniref:Exonuclease domain-containing protein n=1 Tax=Saprolegnia diclina (strain VS20) TaxID=1156394 RepID=T0RQG6_SAPDV|nr:hypothetical protein SDRG_10059 [Saprolegnia diclina VS20]EQC32312.1 hypothetical protein SDRG_10059 [Saprolegnia diclina VS20]|eukprot:XP_008614253.1 hypothetical protein SDRG_10059 [Saprolegnia diclina VS20]
MGRYDGMSSEEEGEIIEETPPVMKKAPIEAAIAAPPAEAPLVVAVQVAPDAPAKAVAVTAQTPPTDRSLDTRKRQQPAEPRPPRSPENKRRRTEPARPAPPKDQPPMKKHDSFSAAEKQKELSRVLREPYQARSSRVLLNFNLWLAEARLAQVYARLAIDDVQTIVTSTLKGDGNGSPFLESYDGVASPSKVCIVLAKGVHPDMLGRAVTSPDVALPFFESCSTVPCGLASATALKASQKPKEVALSESLFRFPLRTTDLDLLSPDELFAGYEVTLLAQYTSESRGWTDEVVLQPSGAFFRKTTQQSGEWKLDGDLLHLHWTFARADDDASKPQVVTAIDVLLAEDDRLRVFRTNDMLDKQYGLASLDPERPLVKRALKVTVLRAAKVNAALTTPSLPSLWTHEPTLDDFILTPDEMIAYGYPMDATVEQQLLMKATKNSSMDVYKATMRKDETQDDADEERLFALDCEMCETDLGSELTRVTVVNAQGETVYDTLVKPRSTILNYHTEFSGITAESLADVKTTLDDVQAHLLSLVSASTLLVGHSLDSDLKALRLVHRRVADTAILFPHQRGFPFKPSLKALASTFLNETIQDMEGGHDSAQDAIAALRLFQLKRRDGLCLGLPTPPLCSRAYTTLLDELPQATKHFGRVGASALPKPWALYSSGDLNDLLTSAVTNAPPTDVGTYDALTLTPDACTKDLLWYEVDVAPSRDPKLYMDTVQLWKRAQVAAISELDASLATLASELPPETLLLVLPQADLSIYRYMKAIRMKSRWNEWESGWTDADQYYLQYAYSGLLDSALFLKRTSGL